MLIISKNLFNFMLLILQLRSNLEEVVTMHKYIWLCRNISMRMYVCVCSNLCKFNF